jgi:hypothetical protein
MDGWSFLLSDRPRGADLCCSARITTPQGSGFFLAARLALNPRVSPPPQRVARTRHAQTSYTRSAHGNPTHASLSNDARLRRRVPANLGSRDQVRLLFHTFTRALCEVEGV